MMDTEFYMNGHDAGYAGDEFDPSLYAPGSSAYSDYLRGFDDGVRDAEAEYEREYPVLPITY